MKQNLIVYISRLQNSFLITPQLQNSQTQLQRATVKSNSFPLWQLNVKSNSFPLGQLRLVRVVSRLGLIRKCHAPSYMKLSFPVETSTYCLSLILLILLRCIRRDLFFMNIFRGFKDKSFHNLHSPPPQHV